MFGFMSGKKHSSVSVLLPFFFFNKSKKKKKKIQLLVGILTGGLPSPGDLFLLGIYPFTGRWGLFALMDLTWDLFSFCVCKYWTGISPWNAVCVLHAKFKAGDCLGVMSHLGKGDTHTRVSRLSVWRAMSSQALGKITFYAKKFKDGNKLAW